VSSTAENLPREPEPRRRAPVALRLLVIPIVAIALAGGFYVIGGQLVQGKTGFYVGSAWWLAVSAGFLLLARRRRELLAPVLGTIAVVTIAAGAWGYVNSRETTVDESIATGTASAQEAQAGGGGGGSEASDGGGSGGGDAPAPGGGGPPDKPAPAEDVEVASGTVEGASGHVGTGQAAIVELADGGRVLTFSEFDIDPGAGDVRVYLAAGDPQDDTEVTDFVDLGDLKGSQGDQQYEIGGDVDLKRYDTAVVWCIPFTTRLAQASL
jgi:hypothetical protein